MDNYLLDREALGELVDELIKKRPLSANNAEELNQLREQMINSLDEKIGTAIFGSFTKEQNAEFNELLDRDDATEEAYQEFFDKTGLKLDQIIANACKSFSDEFLGGQNV